MQTPSLPSIAESLARFAPFDALQPQPRIRLAQGARALRAGRGEMLLHRGSDPGGCYLVIEGEVKLFLISSNGAEKIVRMAGPGDGFCEESAFGGAAQSLSAQATRDSVVVFLRREAVQAAMLTQPQFALALTARLAERIGELVEGLEQCIQRSSTQRVAHYLVQHAEQDAQCTEVRLPCDKQTIASQLNLTPETFSRVLNRLTRDGFILPRGRRSIMLTDLPRLARIAA